MKKKELLVPAGDMECLRQAVYHGADAVYLACKNFGARKFATNFTNDEIVEAIRFCHLYGVRIYITMNTLVRNQEVSSFMEQARFLHEQGVDALIVQDLGMIYLLRKTFPNLEIHASTQANNSSYETVKMFYDLGVKRVVFSRELSIDEIDSIDIPIEKEAFIHGALCVSYSGCCLMSSMLGGRSGNRGECAGCCRLPYTLKRGDQILQKRQYLLSMKELNTSPSFDRLLHSTIDSFKIEGRMKGPVYVGFITSFYRKLMDQVPFSYEEEMDKLKTIFNREFTVGHLLGEEGTNLIHSESPNHIGLKIGKAEVKQDKIKIQLDPHQTLHQYDSIRFLHSNKGMVVNYLYDENDKYCNSSQSVCFVDNKIGFKKDDILMKTQDILLEKETILEESLRKIPITFQVKAKIGQPLRITVSDGKHTCMVEGEMVEEAKSSPTTEEVLREKLEKIGKGPFTIQSIQYDLDSSVFIPMKRFNEKRREVVEQLEQERIGDIVPFVEDEVLFVKRETEVPSTQYSCIVRWEDQLKKCLDLSFDRIIVFDLELYEKYKELDSIYYFVERCPRTISSSLVERNVVSDWMEVGDLSVSGFYPLNVTNIYTAYYLQELGYQNIPLSVELTKEEKQEFLTIYREQFGNAPFEIFSYGRVENMVIDSNVLGIEEGDYSYRLIDQKEREFPVYYDGVNTHIYHHEVFSLSESYENVCYLFDFYQETPDEIASIVKQFRGMKNNY